MYLPYSWYEQKMYSILYEIEQIDMIFERTYLICNTVGSYFFNNDTLFKCPFFYWKVDIA